MRSRSLLSTLLLVLLSIAALGLLAACGSDDSAPATATPFALPTATPTPQVQSQATTEQQSQAPSTKEPAATEPTSAPTVAPRQNEEQSGNGQTNSGQSNSGQPNTGQSNSGQATGESEPPPTQAGPPDQGNWIDVNVSSYTVSLMQGNAAVQVIGPVAVGEQVDTGAYLSTQTGLFHVYSMNAALTYDAPYDTYISDWVGFDPNLANGFHSFLKDADGNVVDASTGNVSNGCIRTPAPEAIYNFATIGMPVYVHY
jgi:hypothetical protein